MTTERLGIRTILLRTSGLVVVFTLPLWFTDHALLLLALRGISMVAISPSPGDQYPSGPEGRCLRMDPRGLRLPQGDSFHPVEWFFSSGMFTAYFLLSVEVEAAIDVVPAPLPANLGWGCGRGRSYQEDRPALLYGPDDF
jgi:hypothetical protein